MAIDTCPRCNHTLPTGAAYCPACGTPVLTHPPENLSTRPGFSIFWLTLLGSLALTAFMVFVMGWPVFILGAFLPLFWIKRER